MSNKALPIALLTIITVAGLYLAFAPKSSTENDLFTLWKEKTGAKFDEA